MTLAGRARGASPPPAAGTAATRRAHERFAESGGFPAGLPAPVRAPVADSWLRSAAAGVDPDGQRAPRVLDEPEVADYRAAHPLSAVFPLLYDVLGQVAEACDYVMAVGDAHGTLLWVCGARDVLRRAESINFVEGAAWDESRAGTNAPGMALALDDAVTVRTAEHYARTVQAWSCAAAPIHDPTTHEVLGVVDITGGTDVASPQTLGLVRTTARLAETELARLRAAGGAGDAPRLWTPRAPSEPLLQLTALGRAECLVRRGEQSLRLGRRHSEIVVALAETPDGLTAEQLEVEVYPEQVHSSTTRAELARLKTLLGGDVLASRPYRLVGPIQTDWRTVAADLAARRVGDALRGYAGPLLPKSEAPAVVRVREQLERQLRAAVVASEDIGLLTSWTRSRWGADDLAVWTEQLRLLPAHSPLRPVAVAEVARLERALR